MKKLLAKLKSHQPEFRVIFDEEHMPKVDFFAKPEVSMAIEYAPLYESGSKEEWFFVDLDKEQRELMIDQYTEARTFGVPGIEQAEYTEIEAICMIDGNGITFAKITNAMKIGEHGKQLLSFTENSVEFDRPSFAIDFSGQADAFYNGQNRLYFQSLSKVRSLFKGIEVFQQEATRQEKELFLANDFFAVGEFNPDYISIKDTQKISEIRDNTKLDLEDPATQQKIRDYAHEFPSSGVSINDDGQIMINSKNDVSAAIKLLNQNYFTSVLTGEKFEAKNIVKMKR